MLKYCFQGEDYWIKTLYPVYWYGLNDRTKFMNKDSPIGTFPHHFQDNALLTTENSPKRLITTFYLTLNFSSIFKNNLFLNIEVTNAESYLKALRKEY